MTGIIALVLSVGISLVALCVVKASRPSKRVAITASAICTAVFLLSIAYSVSYYFTGVGIDESVIFHVRYGLDGAGFGEYSRVILATLLSVSLAFLLAVVGYRVCSPQVRTGSQAGGATALLLLTIAVAVNPAIRDLVAIYSPLGSGKSTLPRDYVVPTAKSIFPGKNLVFIYLESVERTYLDEDLFPGLAPNLKSLEEASLSFTNISQVWGTTATIAGMVGSQCGMPLVAPTHGNSMSGMDRFLEGAVCMGDVLAASGYSLSFLGGADLEFAGKGKFYKTHGFQVVEGRQELLARLPEDQPRSAWGIFDDVLFSTAVQRFGELRDAGGPFGLFLLTLDTHHPRGHVSPRCKDVIYGDGSNPMLNAVHCSDKLVGDFIAAMSREAYADDTVLVIASDHLAMRNTAWATLKKGDRKNLFIIADPSRTEPKRVERQGSILDIGATVLASLGLPIEELGFGRDLESDLISLAEVEEDLDEFLIGQKKSLMTLWGYPSLEQGMEVVADERTIKLGNRQLKFPALITLRGRSLVPKAITFEFDNPRKLIEQVGDLPGNQPIVWVDRCVKVSALLTSPVNGSRWCLGVSKLDAAHPYVEPILTSIRLSPNELQKMVAGLGRNKKLLAERMRNFERYKDYGVAHIVPVDIGIQGEVTLRSLGGIFGQSFIETSSKARRDRVEFKRGLSMVGLTKTGEHVKLAHLDTCDRVNPVIDDVKPVEQFSQLVEETRGQFEAYVVVAHDSADCGQYHQMSRLFSGLDLKKGERLGFREPYIGIVGENGMRLEVTGDASHSVAVRLSGSD